ncbi:hypothetical protein MF271_11465 [Deinococcus sp. KNUC1210]|uniref:hypothetical protein n=1 Tax=Deinococcus sp. KNUC1210 TaxID=2917691 RepID=UPI001EF10C1B|nr:hypothetical protein [Deinococcus sp. KNUC1210]ULH14627.1 hypothetical protein MF271_11465 [Deinococcus sp. KNUC1210]
MQHRPPFAAVVLRLLAGDPFAFQMQGCAFLKPLDRLLKAPAVAVANRHEDRALRVDAVLHIGLYPRIRVVGAQNPHDQVRVSAAIRVGVVAFAAERRQSADRSELKDLTWRAFWEGKAAKERKEPSVQATPGRSGEAAGVGSPTCAALHCLLMHSVAHAAPPSRSSANEIACALHAWWCAHLGRPLTPAR